MKTYLLDTNILLRLIDPKSQDHGVVKQAMYQMAISENIAVLVPQNIIELWAVATRPTAANGLGYDLEKTRIEVDDLLLHYELLRDKEEIFDTWLELVTTYKVSGKQVHDTRLVAAMLTHNLEHILTINTTDFKRFTEITAVHPQEISA
jgi:predicted nucleic acid-binding protein